jgi:hypothetical protein
VYYGEVLRSAVSIAQIKNLQRRLNVLEQEAITEVTRACGHEHWQSLGFDALDAIEDGERRARANFYFGQLQTARNLMAVLG